MKIILLFILLISQAALAQSDCDIRPGQTMGVRIVEFATGNVVHSKMQLKEMSVSTLNEEMMNLQDMGICEEKIQKKKCILKFEKKSMANQLTLIRGIDRWLTWSLDGKKSAQKFVKILQLAGFCQ